MLAASANARGLAAAVAVLRPQDVFATSLYPGQAGTQQTITLPFAPDLVWEKIRSLTGDHLLFDRLRGNTKLLSTNTTAAEGSNNAGFSSLLSSGYTSSGFSNGSSVVGWAFKRAAKFYDEVPYTGDGTSGRVIPHALGIKPGMIIVKRRDTGTNWLTYQRSVGAGNYLSLNTTDAVVSSSAAFPSEPTDTGFSVGSAAGINASGGTYVAYLFAHDPDTTNGIVQCGSFTGSASAAVAVSLGWRPQFLILKSAGPTASNWEISDTARGIASPGNDSVLFANTSGAEISSSAVDISSTGFSVPANQWGTNNVVFLAIRAPIT